MGSSAKAAWITALTFASGCPRFEEPLGCGPSLSCPDGLVCSEGSRLCCAPLECGDACVPVSNACGDTRECACACTPRDCELAGAECGVIDDGCGSALFCGGCSGADYCERDHRCVTNGTCLGRAECGSVGVGAQCGGCALGSVCTSTSFGRCEARDRMTAPLCWGPLRPLVPSSTVAHRVFPVYEGSALLLYSETNAFRPGDPGCTRHAWFLQLVPGLATTSTPRRLPSSELPTVGPTGTVACSGTAGVPFVRGDGLEMFFVATYPCNDEASRRMYLSSRETTGHAWSPPKVIATPPSMRTNTVGSPVLLPDNQTLLYSRDHPQWHVLRRQTATPGDARFVEDPELSSFLDTADPPSGGELYEMTPESISCDGRFLIYSRSYDPRAYDLRMAEILPSAPGEGPRFGRPMRHSSYPAGTVFPKRVVESPDCGVLYVSTSTAQLFATRRPCDQ